MDIRFEDSETCVVTVAASVVDEDSGACVEDGQQLHEIALDADDDAGYSPRIVSHAKRLVFPADPDRRYALDAIAAGRDSAYRIDADASDESVEEAVRDLWWTKFGGDHHEWVGATHESPGYWS